MVLPATVALLCAVGGVASIIVGIARNGLSGSSRFLFMLFGVLVAVVCGWMGLVWLYLSVCEPARNCL
jgi:hypothetical protein